MAYRAAHDDGIDLSVSNPTVCGLPQIDPDVEALRAAISAHYTASSQGLIVAREAVAAYYGGRANPDAIQLFASTSEAVGALLKLLCAPGLRGCHQYRTGDSDCGRGSFRGRRVLPGEVLS